MNIGRKKTKHCAKTLRMYKNQTQHKQAAKPETFIGVLRTLALVSTAGITFEG